MWVSISLELLGSKVTQESKSRLDKLRNKPTNPDSREHKSEHINFWSDLEKSADEKGKAKDEFPDMQLQRPSARWYDSQDDRAHARDAEPQRKRFKSDKWVFNILKL